MEAVFSEDLAPAAEGPYRVTVQREITKGERGSYATSVITVYHESSHEPVLETETAEYVKEVGR